ncbi:hypothetical protein NQ317_014046 [Molorchus minor]|uniref:CNH domain-containing protein n=1 Tax=Molorchus minor TaxID=1323400 RepID=A0ABQ9JZG5_9CUCU|nr:hypothetical protein NQ317_014046 [Molorchus minor]
MPTKEPDHYTYYSTDSVKKCLNFLSNHRLLLSDYRVSTSWRARIWPPLQKKASQGMGFAHSLLLEYPDYHIYQWIRANWFHSDELQDMDGTATVVPRRENLNIVSVAQLDKDSILICYDNIIRIVTPQGKPKINKKQISELRFDFKIDSLICLPDSILAFHKHGVQGRSLKKGEITQEISDTSRTYKLLGSDKVVMLESGLKTQNRLYCKILSLLTRNGDLKKLKVTISQLRKL